MTSIKAAAEVFLDARRIAVTGVSRTPGSHGANVVYTRLRELGYEVFAVNPNAEDVEGDPAYANLGAIPGGVEAVVVATRPQHASATVQEAIDLGIMQVWMHRSVDKGSVDDDATRLGRAHGLTVIDGGCPLMYGRASDRGHRVMCRVLSLTRRIPRTV
ncbi:CoA-binding protein [Cellulomonas fimi]|uniref:CoA-binding domain protein n=1 Tax=Cellulomonas fimi (strain ATCC 484 / DSM 20113 / JCM 1341 / CCUG 24087 / LMG 16345 / NBRC 15513 / NCIMB 8980 / NCTC 7547 / NRS-133) TaxID=590998 RepID=F4H5X8_CELFA|nr:CoA-binding protein [Cellulomonas fimi]AEE46708.1 CoA-binding domain protein [Cellulomonas fimi ATCC 484]NNH07647.1 CoA-binding protein [Cellulomonas fimi]VEH33945.1 acetyl coenzyme A synthetase (ADP forming), alpha domain [Cellulomonas fimi]